MNINDTQRVVYGYNREALADQLRRDLEAARAEVDRLKAERDRWKSKAKAMSDIGQQDAELIVDLRARFDDAAKTLMYEQDRNTGLVDELREVHARLDQSEANLAAARIMLKEQADKLEKWEPLVERLDHYEKGRCCLERVPK